MLGMKTVYFFLLLGLQVVGKCFLKKPDTIRESKSMGAIFQKKVLRNIENVRKYFEKGQVIACDNRTQ